MTELEFKDVCEWALSIFRDLEPNASGNMMDKATKLETLAPFHNAIVIDEAIAPYSIYTDINWGETSPVIVNSKDPAMIGRSSFLWNNGDHRMRTPKKNPNEGWVEAAVDMLAKRIAMRFCGNITKLEGEEDDKA